MITSSFAYPPGKRHDGNFSHRYLTSPARLPSDDKQQKERSIPPIKYRRGVDNSR
jgi:hypothetical protein